MPPLWESILRRCDVTVITLSKLNERYLITGYEPDADSKVCFTFSSGESGELRIGNYSEKIKNGVCVMEIRRLCEGIHTPIFSKKGERIHLDAIRIEAGVVAPHFDQVKKLIDLQTQLYKLSQKSREFAAELSDISGSVYGTIF